MEKKKAQIFKPHLKKLNLLIMKTLLSENILKAHQIKVKLSTDT